jgi:hypothetical protein
MAAKTGGIGSAAPDKLRRAWAMVRTDWDTDISFNIRLMPFLRSPFASERTMGSSRSE